MKLKSKLVKASRLLTLNTIVLVAVASMTACAPRHCDAHYSKSCFKADDAKARIFGDYAEKHDPVVKVIIANAGGDV